jgi:hypothetical protein
MLELFLALSASSETIYLLFMLFVSTTLSSPASFIFLHRVFCVFWIGWRIKIFKSISTLLRPILHDIRLTSGFAGVFRFHKQSPRLHLTVIALDRGLHALGNLSPFPTRGGQTPRFSADLGGSLRYPLARGFPRTVGGLHEPPQAAPDHSPSLNLCCCLCYCICFNFLCISGLFCICNFSIFICLDVCVLKTLYTP